MATIKIVLQTLGFVITDDLKLNEYLRSEAHRSRDGRCYLPAQQFVREVIGQYPEFDNGVGQHTKNAWRFPEPTHAEMII